MGGAFLSSLVEKRSRRPDELYKLYAGKGAAMVKWVGVSVTGFLGLACLGFAGLWAYAIVSGDHSVGLPT